MFNIAIVSLNLFFIYVCLYKKSDESNVIANVCSTKDTKSYYDIHLKFVLSTNSKFDVIWYFIALSSQTDGVSMKVSICITLSHLHYLFSDILLCQAHVLLCICD